MTTFEKLFEKIDYIFKDKKNSELSIVYISIFVIIFAISYLYIFPIGERILSQAKNETKNLKIKITKEKNYIASKTVNGNEMFYVQKSKRDLKNLKNILEVSIYNNGYIDNKLRELSYLLYNDINWANFIDNISKDAKRNNVNINYIKNKFNKLNYKKVEQIIEIEVDADGSFDNLLKFINSIEESNLIVDIHSLKMNVNKDIHVNFKIAVWGIKY